MAKQQRTSEKETGSKDPVTPKIVLVTKSGHKLTPQQALFCELYASDREFFGNGVQSYIEAYDVDTSKPGWYATAKSGASENLTKPYILERIEEIFEAHGLNDQFVDKQLEKLICQDADFKSKLGAIQEYNKMKGRIINRQQIDEGIEIKPILPKREDKK